jgi:hypothetical protein
MQMSAEDVTAPPSHKCHSAAKFGPDFSALPAKLGDVSSGSTISLGRGTIQIQGAAGDALTQEDKPDPYIVSKVAVVSKNY